MKKKLGFIFLILFFVIALLNINVYAADLDVIQSFVITATPRSDATVDFIYQIKWKVLDSTSEGPLTWVKIGLPNSYAESVKARTDNIASIRKTGEYVRIDFDDEYHAGETITFVFSFNQPYLFEEKNGKIIYEYIPAWFDSCRVNNLMISWLGDGTVKSNNNKTDGELLVWEKENLNKGQKVKVEIQYDESYFSGVDSSKPSKGLDSTSTTAIIVIVIFLILLVASLKANSSSYHSHRGYYGTTYTPRVHYNTRSHRHRPEPAWRRRERRNAIWNDDDFGSFGGFGGGRSSGGGGGCACACACAGSGRAGCSKKDFYGTKLKSKMIIEELEK